MSGWNLAKSSSERWLAVLWALVALAPLAAQDDAATYQVGGGDVLEILVPRYPEFSKQYLVSREGTITVDLLEEVKVGGLTAAQIAELLIQRFQQYLRHPEGLTVRVVAKRMTIKVLGCVGQPGQKEVPRGSNVQEVVAAAGGTLPGAILTRVVIRRQHGDWTEEIPVDLKAYLEGRGTLPELRGDDEVFVPRVTTDATVERPLTPADIADPDGRGKVQVLGAVAAPGEVALRESGSLLSALTAAGGWTDAADLTRIRRVPGGEGDAEVIDLQAYLDQGGTLPILEPGDVIHVPSRALATRTVRVLGAVATPGPVQLPPDADLQTALTAAGGALPQGDLRHIVLLRREGRDLVRREIDLDAYLRAGDPDRLPPLRNEDVVFVPKANVPVEAPTSLVYVFGQVARPGPYPLVEQRPLLHALASAGGALPTADLSRVRITRGGAGGDRAVEFDLQGYQDGRVTELPELRDGDIITLEPNRVTVVGAVVKPGPADLPMNATVVDALSAAGGPLDTADLSRVVITRPTADGPMREVVNLEVYLYEPAQAPPVPRVRGGDLVAVEAGLVDTKLAYVMGQVQRPGPVTIPGPSASILYVLAQAGGVSPTADAKQVRIVRPGPGGLDTRVLDLKALTRGEVAAVPTVEPGDLVSVDDIAEGGGGVLVLGAVARQGRYPVREGQRVVDTIGLAGGLLPTAKPSRARLIHPSGEVQTINLSDFSQHGAPSPLVRDGDVLVIPHEREGRSVWEELMRVFPFVALFLR